MQAMKRKEAAACLQEVDRLINDKQFDEARRKLELLDEDSIVGQAVINLQLGQAYYVLGDYLHAVAVYLRILQVEPENITALVNISAAYQSLQQFGHAVVYLDKALAINPDSAPALGGKGALMLALNEIDKAIEWLEKAVSKKALDVHVYSNLSLALGLLGRNEESLAYADQARRKNPKNPTVLCALSRTLVALGRMEEAERFLRKAIEQDPAYGPAYEQLIRTRKFKPEDMPFIEKTVGVLQQGMRVVDRYNLLFAIGKMYDDVGDYEKAFSYYRQGNVLAKGATKPDDDQHLIRCQKKLLTADCLANPGSYGNTSELPLFIVGMPRSGTSLMEQIIDSHPHAAGAGELTEIPRIMDEIYMAAKRESRFGIERYVMPDSAMWQEQAEAYIRVLKGSGRSDALRVVDKLPDNYRFLGLIATMFPKARIIHAVRHPLDVCISCYFQLFFGLKWSLDLKWIADSYCQYRELMEYWNSVLPAGRIVEMPYELLIEDPENQARQLIDACGLPWDPACLDYAKNRRGVQTVSAWQVRQPIYTTSKMRWVNYAPYIGELAQGIVEYLDDTDIEILAQHGVKIHRKRWKFL
ncbi:MAG TPA: sulfotransferase [Pseudomonadales bacterium]|nr:sulfotransferase [Pseudomonadales bacterium]